MDNQDQLYKQFHDASKQTEEKEFPGMEKLWDRVEEKLDKKILKKESNSWKKIAIAASVLLVVTFGYQIMKTPKEVIIPVNEVVKVQPKEMVISDSISEKNSVADVAPKNPLIKKDAEKIVTDAVMMNSNVATNEEMTTTSDSTFITPEKKTEYEKNINSNGYQKRKFNAVSVQHSSKEVSGHINTSAIEAKQVQNENSPLVIIDGKAIKVISKKNASQVIASKLNAEEIESIEILSNPLYIINGVEFTEQELFGANPTSPYYPLNKQQIVSTTILKGEIATSIYGKKGKNGVVVIATKNKQPIKN